MDVSVEFDAEPDEAGLLAGLHHRRVFRTSDRDVAEFADLAEPTPLPAVRHAALCAPVTEAWLPWSAAVACVARLFETFPPALLASTNVILRPLGPEPTPMLMFPRTGPVLGFGLLPYIPAAALQSVLPVVEAAGSRLVAAGAKRYLTGWVRRGADECGPTSGGNGRRFCVGRRPSIRAAFSAMDSSAMARDHDIRRQRRDTGNCYTWRRHGCGSELHDTVGFAGRRSRGVVCGCLARVAPAHARVPA